MRTLLTCSFALLGLVIACDGSTDASSSQSGPDGGTPTSALSDTSTAAQCVGVAESPTCEAPIDVATAEQAFERIEALTEVKDETIKPASGADLRPTQDLRFTAKITLDAQTATARKPACQGTETERDSCYEWTFAPEKPFHTSQISIIGDWKLGDTYPAGVSCVKPATGERRGCEQIAIEAGTVVRFQRVLEPFYFGRSFHHYLRVVRACTTACDAATELRCAASTTCMKTGKDFCRLCEGGGAEVCFCRDGCGTKADGEKCTYPSSDDTFRGKACKAGVCEN